MVRIKPNWQYASQSPGNSAVNTIAPFHPWRLFLKLRHNPEAHLENSGPMPRKVETRENIKVIILWKEWPLILLSYPVETWHKIWSSTALYSVLFHQDQRLVWHHLSSVYRLVTCWSVASFTGPLHTNKAHARNLGNLRLLPSRPLLYLRTEIILDWCKCAYISQTEVRWLVILLNLKQYNKPRPCTLVDSSQYLAQNSRIILKWHCKLTTLIINK